MQDKNTRSVIVVWCTLSIGVAGLLMTGHAVPRVEAADPLGSNTRLATYDTATGDTFFALSLVPQVEVPAVRACDVIVLFDTSASQTGAYRTESLEVLQAALGQLHEDSRVRLYAIDLLPMSMNDALVAATDPAILKAMDLLSQRIPLGATDLAVGLREASKAFPKRSPRPRRVIYIGDGISRANILQVEEFRELAEQLVTQRISISSFATGPQLDFQMLAALANHTGGMIYVDRPELSPQQAGTALAVASQQGVFWPVSNSLPAALQEVFPQRVPPLRADRDSILIGKLQRGESLKTRLKVELDGRQTQLAWEIAPEKSNEAFNFLPQLVKEARVSQGWSLPTAGSAGLREVARLISSSAQELIQFAQRAFKNVDLEGANTVADAVLRRAPGNPDAEAIKRVIRKKKRESAVPRTSRKKNPLRSGGSSNRPRR